MAITEKRIKQVVDVRDRLTRAVSELEWAYRGLYYTSQEAPNFDGARRRAQVAAQDLLDLLPILENDVD